MNTFTTMQFKLLRNEMHLQYHLENASVLALANPAALGIKSQYEAYIQAIEAEKSLLDPVRKSEYTEKIHEQDVLREEIFTGFRYRIKAELHDLDANRRETAKKLQIVFDNYYNILKRTLNEETAAIDDLIRELDDHHGAEMSALQLGKWTKALGAANAKLQEYIQSRTLEAGGKSDAKMREARVETDNALRALFLYVESLAITTGAEKFQPTIKNINAITKRYKALLAQLAGNRQAKPGDKPGGKSDKPNK